MSEEFRLTFEVCLPPRVSVPHKGIDTTANGAPATQREGSVAWFQALFERLWRHGCSYSEVRSARWDDELQTSRCSFRLEDGDSQVGSLAAFIKSAAQVPDSFLSISNGVSALRMSFDFTSVERESERLSTVSLVANNHDTTPPGKDGQPYLHVAQAFLHTCALLCEALDPLYGLGYDVSQISSQEGNDALAFLGEATATALLHGALPSLDRWLSSAPIEYLAPAYLTPERTLARLASPQCALQRLTTGGLFITPTIAPYTYEASSAYHLLEEGQQAWQTWQAANQAKEQTTASERAALVRQEGIRALERAVGLFAVAQDTAAERSARFWLARFT